MIYSFLPMTMIIDTCFIFCYAVITSMMGCTNTTLCVGLYAVLVEDFDFYFCCAESVQKEQSIQPASDNDF